tara:strand:- start:3084 stop:3488 length:405 start_codon:yes stop_codon:yes gene_type:complete
MEERKMQKDLKPYLKNCPMLTSEEAAKVNFDFTEETYMKIQNMVEQFPGQTSEEYASQATFYNFTPKTMETAFKLFNTWRNTYYNICGPFICKDNRWFPIYSKKYVDTLKLANENTQLRSRIKELEEKLATRVV